MRLKGFYSVVLLLAAIAFQSTSLHAQVENSDFQKLFDLYTMEEYDKCAYKAERYSTNQKYSREP